MVEGSVDENKIICLEGKESRYFYIIKYGRVEISTSNRITILIEGDYFGEEA